MARTGLYKSEVKKARDAVLAQGKHPSVDAVRIALGNTGSKTTIHKYLKELDEEEGEGGGSRASISEALQDLVARLAAQLQDDANARVDAIQAQAAEKTRENTQTEAELRDEIGRLSAQLQQSGVALQREQAAHADTRAAMQAETIVRHTAEQQVAGLKERLVGNEAHRRSLEEKHKHAREALEHYRQSIKEQRDQDQRRHEQQVQQVQTELRQMQQAVIVKQSDITRLNQEGARLVSDLSHVQKALYDEQGKARGLAQKLETFQAVDHRNALLEAQLAEKARQIQALLAQIENAGTKAETLSGQVHGLEIALAAAHAKQASQQEMVAELRSFLKVREQRPISVNGGS